MKTPAEPVTVDDMLKKSGDFNRYQLLLLVLFSYVNIIAAMNYFAQTFISVVPEHWCNATELSNMEGNEDTLPKIRHYLKGLKDPSCSKYMWNESRAFMEDGFDMPVNKSDLRGVQEVACADGWVYYDENGYKSIVADMDWVCEDAWKPIVGQSMYFIGSVIGTFSFGILSDRIGRLPIVMMSFCAAFLGNIITYFSYDLPVFATGRLVAGVATDSMYFMMYIIVMEYVRPSTRTFSLNITTGLFYGGGSAIVPFLATWTGNWRDFLLATSLPILFVMTYYFIVPESALWLLSKGHVDKAVGCFKRIAAINARSISEEDISTFTASQIAGSDAQQMEGNLISLFKTPRLRRQMLILIYKSMVLTLCYDAISRNIDGLGVSPFLMFSAASLTLLPASFIIMMVQDRVGRKATASLALLLTGIVVAASGVMAAFDQGVYATAALVFLARLGINTAYNSGTQYAAELVPTVVRGQGVAVMHVVGYAATFFSSYILFLNHISPLFPALILGFLCILCAFFCLLLPETLGRVLPTTMEDGERFGEGDSMCDFYCCTRNTTVSTLDLMQKEDGDCS